MQRYHAKLKAERGDKRATDKHRKKECERKQKQRAKKAEENKSKPVTPKRKNSKTNKKRSVKDGKTPDTLKKNNVLRVQNWRLRVKLNEKEDAHDTEAETI